MNELLNNQVQAYIATSQVACSPLARFIDSATDTVAPLRGTHNDHDVSVKASALIRIPVSKREDGQGSRKRSDCPPRERGEGIKF